MAIRYCITGSSRPRVLRRRVRGISPESTPRSGSEVFSREHKSWTCNFSGGYLRGRWLCTVRSTRTEDIPEIFPGSVLGEKYKFSSRAHARTLHSRTVGGVPGPETFPGPGGTFRRYSPEKLQVQDLCSRENTSLPDRGVLSGDIPRTVHNHLSRELRARSN